MAISDVALTLYLFIGFLAGCCAMYLLDKKLMEKKFEDGLKIGLALHELAEALRKGVEIDGDR